MYTNSCLYTHFLDNKICVLHASVIFIRNLETNQKEGLDEKRSTKNINDQNSLKTIIGQKFLEVVPCKS